MSIDFVPSRHTSHPADGSRTVPSTAAISPGRMPFATTMTSQDLASAQTGCALCRIVHDDLTSFGPDDCKGSVLLHQFQGFTFRLSHSPTMRTRPAPWMEQPRLYELFQRRSLSSGMAKSSPTEGATPFLRTGHRKTFLLRVHPSQELRSFGKFLSDCPLNSRYWYLQQKLMSPALLHLGS